jgi:AcrR family transcriptional regulator
MSRAGLERTIFYRHFDNVGELVIRAARGGIDELYAAQLAVAEARADLITPQTIRDALELPVRIYHRHGPLLRAVAEGVAANQLVTPHQEAIRRRFDELVVDALRASAGEDEAPADAAEIARALNLLSESYLLDAFGREPRVTIETAVRTLTAIWEPVLASVGD